MRSVLLCDIMQRIVVIPYRRFRTTRLSRGFGKELPLYVA